MKPLFLSEISAVEEVIGVFMTQLDGLRFATVDEVDETVGEAPSGSRTIPRKSVKKNLNEKLLSLKNVNVCIFPLYSWVVMDQESLDLSNVQFAFTRLREGEGTLSRL